MQLVTAACSFGLNYTVVVSICFSIPLNTPMKPLSGLKLVQEAPSLNPKLYTLKGLGSKG